MKTMNDDGKQLESMLGEFGKMQDQERKQFVCKTSKFHPENNEYDSAEDEADIKAPQVCWKCQAREIHRAKEEFHDEEPPKDIAYESDISEDPIKKKIVIYNSGDADLE